MKKSLVIGIVLVLVFVSVFLLAYGKISGNAVEGKPAVGEICDDEGIPCMSKLKGVCIKLLPFSSQKFFIPTGPCDGKCVDKNCIKEDIIMGDDDKLMKQCADNCFPGKCNQILDSDKREFAWEQYCLNKKCDRNVLGCEDFLDDENFLGKLALSNVKEEREVTVKITAKHSFNFYLNGVEQLSGDNENKLYEKDIKMSDGDIVLIYSGGRGWLVFEGLDKETEKLVFYSNAANSPDWVTYPVNIYNRYYDIDQNVEVHSKDLSEWYNKDTFKYKAIDVAMEFTEYYPYTFRSAKGDGSINSQLNSKWTKPIWGYYETYNGGWEKSSQFFIGRKIRIR